MTAPCWDGGTTRAPPVGLETARSVEVFTMSRKKNKSMRRSISEGEDWLGQEMGTEENAIQTKSGRTRAGRNAVPGATGNEGARVEK